ncbi:Tn3 family transposase [Chengkuizengella sediminis]|uniref:Tn3 family transposase n=1 Tax=Chengkuizengella sediminis TaxID=1885917 RepID=UPI001F0DDF64|nr:Tn3 family transposase [Chengkuizengella sediminis]
MILFRNNIYPPVVHSERIYDYYAESNQNMKKAGEVLKIFTDDQIPASTPFQDVQDQAFAILERQKLKSIVDQITTNTKFDETSFQLEHIDYLARRFKRYLRPIFILVDFVAPSSTDPLIEAIHFMKAAFTKNKALGQLKALNRGESYHKLRKAIAYANFGKLRFKNENDQYIWGECSRLLANSIIYFNASILSNMLAYRKQWSRFRCYETNFSSCMATY